MNTAVQLTLLKDDISEINKEPSKEHVLRMKRNVCKITLDKAVKEEVFKELKRYKGLIIQMKNKEEQEENGVNELFTIISDNSVENRIRVNQINRALEGLDEQERKIIEYRFLDTNNYTDTFIYEDLLMMKKGKYYNKKGDAIEHIARCLGMI